MKQILRDEEKRLKENMREKRKEQKEKRERAVTKEMENTSKVDMNYVLEERRKKVEKLHCESNVMIDLFELTLECIETLTESLSVKWNERSKEKEEKIEQENFSENLENKINEKIEENNLSSSLSLSVENNNQNVDSSDGEVDRNDLDQETKKKLDHFYEQIELLSSTKSKVLYEGSSLSVGSVIGGVMGSIFGPLGKIIVIFYFYFIFFFLFFFFYFLFLFYFLFYFCFVFYLFSLLSTKKFYSRFCRWCRCWRTNWR